MGSLHIIGGGKSDKPPEPEPRVVDLVLVGLLEGLLAQAKACELLALVAIVDYTDEDREPDFLEAGSYCEWRMRGLLDEFKTVITSDDDEYDED